MTRTPPAALLRHIRAWSANHPGGALPDRQLLQRFVASRDPDAFAALLARHAPLVWSVCTRHLRPAQAEDAFQATFLTLADRAPTIRKPDSLGPWLHGVAVHIASRLRASAPRSTSVPDDLPDRAPTPPEEAAARELYRALDEELARLPDRYRSPLVLCYLQALTRDQAARRLGWSLATLKRRLEAGRRLLRARLTRRGLTLPAALLAAGVGSASAVPPALTRATLQAALAATPGPAIPVALPGARCKWAAALLLLAGTVAGVAGVVGTAPPAPEAPPTRPARAEEPRPRTDRLGDPLPGGALARLGTVRFRHHCMVPYACFTPDGKAIVAGDIRGNVIFWDAQTGKELRRFEGLAGPALSPDGKTLAALSPDRIVLWDVPGGRPLRHWPGPREGVMEIRFSPDGKALAVRGSDPVVRLWDSATGKLLHELKGHAGGVRTFAFSPDGKTLASGASDAHVRLWDVASGKELHRIAAHDDVLAVAFSPDGKTLASSGNGATLSFWDPATGKLLRKAPKHYIVTDLAYLPDGKALVGMYGGLRLFDAATGKLLRTFEGEQRAMARLALSPDGKTVVTSWGGAHAVDLWDVATGKLRRTFDDGHRMEVRALAFTAESRALYSGAGIMDYTVRVWDPRTGKPLRRFYEDGHNGADALALSPDGKLMAAGQGGRIILREADTREVVRILEAEGMVNSVSFSGDGKTLSSAGWESHAVRLWDVATGALRHTFPVHQDTEGQVVLSPDGKLLAVSGFSDGGVRLLSAATGKEVRKLETSCKPVFTVAFSPDGRLLAASGGGGAIHLWEMPSGTPVRALRGHDRYTAQLTFSADGRSLLSGGGPGDVRLWEVATGQERLAFRGHAGPVRSVALSPDGALAASGGHDTTILTWDLAVGAKEPPSAEGLAALWADLAGEDGSRAYRAIQTLAGHPGRAVPFLAKHLRPAAPADEEQRGRIARLLAQLDADDFKTRERAASELGKLTPLAVPQLRAFLRGKPSLEAHRRVEALLQKLSASSDRLREVRALEVLERIDSPAARAVLRELAAGAEDHPRTRAAGAALGRLKGRGARFSDR